MTTIKVLEALREVEFLQGIADEYLQELAAVAKLQEFPAGKVIFRTGEPATHIYLIISGNVSLEICSPGLGCKRILTAGEGDLVGWSPVLEQIQLTATARTISDTHTVAISGGQVITLCEHDPRFGYVFMRRAALALAKRLNATRMQLLDLYGSEMPSIPENI